MADVAAMPQFTLHAEFGAQKRRRKLGDKFLGGVRFRAKAGREFPLEAGLISGSTVRARVRPPSKSKS
jgi:hypothetical protein